MPNKFLNVVQTNYETNEISIYGDIVDDDWGYDFWTGEPTKEVDPTGFKNVLDSFGGKAVTLRINSNGGSVFAAHSIHNMIKSYAGKVTCIVDGLAASAASIIVMAADKIIMPANSMIMIHNPLVYSYDPLNEEALNKLLNALKPIKDSIIAAYMSRSKLTKEELSDMMDKDTWLTAKECLDIGFCDKVIGSVDFALNGNYLVVNKVKHKLSDKDIKNIKNKMEVKNMNGLEQLVDAIINKLGINLNNVAAPAPADVASSEPQNKVASSEPALTVENAVQAERERVAAIDALADGSPVVAALVAEFKNNGSNVDLATSILNVVKNAQKENPGAGASFVKDMLQDNADSNVDGIVATPTSGNEEDEAALNKFANFMKRGK